MIKHVFSKPAETVPGLLLCIMVGQIEYVVDDTSPPLPVQSV